MLAGIDSPIGNVPIPRYNNWTRNQISIMVNLMKQGESINTIRLLTYYKDSNKAMQKDIIVMAEYLTTIYDFPRPILKRYMKVVDYNSFISIINKTKSQIIQEQSQIIREYLITISSLKAGVL